MDINTCFETTKQYHTIAYYSHLVPVILALFLSAYAVFKTKFSKLAIGFFAFTLSFSLWLIGDIFPWVSSNYNLVYFTWSWLDYVNVLFFVLGVYFFGILARGKISLLEKYILLTLIIPSFFFTITGNSVVDFYHPACEATNNEMSVDYKVFVEIAALVLLFWSLFLSWRQSDSKKKIQNITVLTAIVLFFAMFSITEYIAATTAVYEINLYGLFILPLFLIIMVFAITNLGVFQFRLLGTQVLAYALIIMAGSQFLFLQDSAESTLSLVTLGMSILLGVLLLQNAKKEADVREKVEKLATQLQVSNTGLAEANTKLRELDKQKTEFISFATHQLRSPLTSMRGYSSLILEGEMGQTTPPVKEAVQTILTSTKTLISLVENYLNVSRMELGTMKYDFKPIDFKELLDEVVREQKTNIETKGLKLNVSVSGDSFPIKADVDKFKQVIVNTIDNSVKYTPQGSITLSLEKKDKNVRFVVSDTGVGINPKTMPKLFKKFSRADNASDANIHGTGLGLFIAKEILTAHGGHMWAESEGEGKGSQFYIEIPEAK
ncbi:MAG TPA: ATP-binding protein [Candidatus Paceibacterota bacterium]|nr:ATP-binding protein [Candidatus Paceibacterota bacterium]